MTIKYASIGQLMAMNLKKQCFSCKHYCGYYKMIGDTSHYGSCTKRKRNVREDEICIRYLRNMDY